MLDSDYFKAAQEEMPVRRIIYSEVVHLADPEVRILEDQILITPDGERIHARMFVDAAYRISGKNPHAKDPKYLDIPIQSMRDEIDKPATELRQEIDAFVRVDFSSSISKSIPLELADIFDADSYVPPEAGEGMSTTKKLTIGAVGAIAITAAAAAGVGFVKMMKKNNK